MENEVWRLFYIIPTYIVGTSLVVIAPVVLVVWAAVAIARAVRARRDARAVPPAAPARDGAA